MNEDASIGVFDSGIGGLTVLKELKHALPGENFVYFGDTARVPYGTKSEATIRRFATEICDFLLERKVKLIVAACNTVSALALDYLARKYSSMPIFGVVGPGAFKAVRSTKTRRIGVIGTVATVASGSYRKAIASYGNGLKVYQKACPLFVPLVENGWTDNNIAKLTAKEYLQSFKGKRIDTLVLGCTHYPLLKPAIGRIMGKRVLLVDSAMEIASNVKSYLVSGGLVHHGRKKGRTEYWLSDTSEYSIHAARFIMKERNIKVHLKKL
jgi:glutamate racemase